MKVYYKRLIEGITTPAIIQNGGYHFIHMPVYEDGTIDCWGRVPIDEAAEKLKQGWLVTSVPVGEHLSIHGLGAYKIKKARWNFTENSYVDHLYSLVKGMNHKMSGLFQETAEQKEKWSTAHVKWNATGIPYKVKSNFGYSMMDGRATSMFQQDGDVFHLVSIIAYADGYYQIGDDSFSSQETTDMIQQKQLLCSPPPDAPIHLMGLGTIEIENDPYSVDPAEKLKELLDYPNELGKKGTAHDRCRAAYHQYLEWPDENARERLRAAYEAVPEHERMYLGDMDTRDQDYLRILFEPDNKREV